jgi:glucose/arabinose dehydrogenase
MFVYDQTGLIFVVQNGKMLPTPLLDVRDRLVPLQPGYDERGLIGLAVHTNFAQFPFIYTYTSETNGPLADFPIEMPIGTTNDHQQVISEWKIDAADSNRVDVASRREILRLDKPQFNHNGGTMRFGPDGPLYFGVGDGGAADDQGPGHSPGGNGQDRSKILGKVGRIDVDARTSANGQYGVPGDNPFVGQPGLVPEIYAYGFRNPYSFSFDLQTGELYLGDVGQNDVEEIDKVVKGGNFGWNIKEGGFFFDPNGTNDGFVTSVPVTQVPSDLIDPIGQYDHDEGIAIIGGFLYRGAGLTNLTGKYVTGDLGSTNLGRLFYLEGTNLNEFIIGPDDHRLGLFLKGFGQDAAGELYVMGSSNIGPSGTAGKVLKIVPLATNAMQNFSVAIRQTSQGLALTWVGGTPPYAIQEKSSLTDATWQDVLTTTNLSVLLPQTNSAAFFRIKDHATP